VTVYLQTEYNNPDYVSNITNFNLICSCPICGTHYVCSLGHTCPPTTPATNEPDPCGINFNSPQTTLKGVGFMQLELRALYPVLAEGLGLTSSASLGFMMDRNGGIGVYYTNSLGISTGAGVAGGASWGVMPTVTSISEMQGLGLNAGYLFAWNGVARSGEVNLIFEDCSIDKMRWDNLRLGVTSSALLPFGYVGAGAGAYVDISYTLFILGSSSSPLETLTQQFNSILPVNLTQDQVWNLYYTTYSNLWNYNVSLASECDE
jgi:hypothetical protein